MLICGKIELRNDLLINIVIEKQFSPTEVESDAEVVRFKKLFSCVFSIKKHTHTHKTLKCQLQKNT